MASPADGGGSSVPWRRSSRSSTAESAEARYHESRSHSDWSCFGAQPAYPTNSQKSVLHASPFLTSSRAPSRVVCDTPRMTGIDKRLAALVCSEWRQTISRGPLPSKPWNVPPSATSPPNQTRQPFNSSAEGRFRMMPFVNESSCWSSSITDLWKYCCRSAKPNSCCVPPRMTEPCSMSGDSYMKPFSLGLSRALSPTWVFGCDSSRSWATSRARTSLQSSSPV
mmetsp:Transcript_30448/g.50423  ORF Transcript_30448/g.50423 Transcript_30448/m.50423 type:complete len:224 (+) Transcript_30448:1274-1945(+)